MSFETKLAWRYFRSRRRGLVRFTSIIAVVGIAAGVASLIVAQAISKGFSDKMQEMVLDNTSHIAIFNEGKTNVSDWRILEQKIIDIENVNSISPTTYESAVITSDENSSYGVIRVMDAPAGRVTNAIKDADILVSLGLELAEKLKLKIGDEANIISLGEGIKPKTSTVRVKNIFETGLYEYDATWIAIDQKNYLRLKDVDKFSPTAFSVVVGDIYAADITARNLRKSLGEDFKVIDWQEANKPLFVALSLEKKVAFAVILVILFIAVLNITTTLALLVAERRLDIAILRTSGAKTQNLVTIFLFEGIILSLLGIVLGVIGSIVICFAGNYFKFISLPKEVYSVNYVPFHIDFWSVFGTVLLTFLLSLMAILYPALKASRIKPLENLRRQ